MDDTADGWKEAVIAWEVCASIHREYAKGKDPLYTTRQMDFLHHAGNARYNYDTFCSESGKSNTKGGTK